MSSDRRARLIPYRESQRRYRPDRRQFARLVSEALAQLPAEFRSRLDNVEIVVEDWPPTAATTASEADQTLLGLYQGTPYGSRGVDYHLVTPDRITIYRGPILEICATREDVVQEIRETVVHEIGHYFGLDEHELR